MTDPDELTEAQRRDRIFAAGAGLGLEYGHSEYKPYPRAGLAWWLATLAFVVPPVALVAIPLAVRAARRGNRLAWLAAVWAVVAAGLAVLFYATLIPDLGSSG